MVRKIRDSWDSIVISIPHVPVSINNVIGKHWAYRYAEVQKWRKWVQDYAIALYGCDIYNWLTDKPEKRKVIIRVYKKGRAFDPDNLLGSVKFIVDALKCYNDAIKGELVPNFIYDDSSKYLDLKVKQCHSEDEHVEIEVFCKRR